MNRLLLLASAASLGALGAQGCTPGGGAAQDPQGRFHFTLGEDVQPQTEGRKVRWREAEVTLAAQRVERRRPYERATLAEVGRALERRHTLGELQGTLRSWACELAGERARCIEGSFEQAERRMRRRGWVVVDGDDLLLVELVADASRAEVLDRERRRLEQSFEWTRGAS